MEGKTYKIVIDDAIVSGDLDLEQAYLDDRGLDQVELIHVTGSDEDFINASADADGVSIWCTLGDKEYDRLEKCSIVVMPGIGLDKYDIPAATRHGICIANVPDYCIDEVAIHSLALMLACVRRITSLNAQVKMMKPWEEIGIDGIYGMKGKNYGLVSFGNIPKRLSELLKPFGVNIIAYDPFVSKQEMQNYQVEKVETINELFSRCDFISVHTPYMKETHHIISAEQFDLIQGDAVLVVAGRGGVVDEDALIKAINKGKIRSAGLDVIEDEDNLNKTLLEMEQVIATPHMASESVEATIDLRTKIIEQLVATVCEKRAPRYLVNKDVLPEARFMK